MSDLSIYDFVDYRRFLRAWLDARPSRSMRGFAPQAGVSVALLSGIVNGKKALDLSRIRTFARALRLDADQASYFSDLVAQEHAGTDDLRTLARERVQATRLFRGMRPIDVDTAEMIGDVRHSAVLELSHCADWRDDPAWVAERLRIVCTPGEAAESMALLERLGALVRDGQGRRVNGGDTWSTGHQPDPGVVAQALMTLHHSVLAQAGVALTEVDATRRQFGTLTFACDSARLPELEDRVRRFQEEIILFAQQCEGHADMVCHVGTQLFPLTEPTGGDPGEEGG